MKILFAASEANPIVKVGGIADVVGSLSREIGQAGHDVRIVIPFYGFLKQKNFFKKASFKIALGRQQEKVEIWETSLPGGKRNTTVYLVKSDRYFLEQEAYLPQREFSHLSRFLFFSKAVTEMFEAVDWTPETVHCHDWHTGTIPLFLKIKRKEKKRIKTLFTIHNLLIQGRWNRSQVVNFLDLRENKIPSLMETSGPGGNEFNTMQQAILNADLINAVSPTYAKEIKTDPEYARGLDKAIRQREKDITGILNGIDQNLFNPRTNQDITRNYSFKTIDIKGINKTELQKSAGLEIKGDAPLLAMISRLDTQKGVDLVCRAAGRIVENGGQLVFLGRGEAEYENMLRKIPQDYPGRAAVYLRFDAALAQRIYAGADVFLMPSLFEPCGLTQLIAMRYGTIPLVRKTGGLADTVEDVKIREGGLFRREIKGTGFVFEKYSLSDFLTALDRAFNVYARPDLWRKLQKNAMLQDFSWRKSAKKYLKLYKKLLI